MQLNPDCIRDILLTIEEITAPSKYMIYLHSSDFARLKKYTDTEVTYHINQCHKSNLIYGVRFELNQSISIEDLSPSGHEFLANIRADSNWNKIKKASSEIGSNSLNAIMQIAISVISSVITDKFN